jgi:TonB family protein
VRSAGFAETTAAPEPARPRSRPVETPSTPIEILSKPKPSYTEEARAVRVEGEVVLEVRFGASGRTEVLRVVSGLGHGLDESAKRAAEQIVFKPARHDGEPVDFTALVRMVFQLT